MLCISLCLNPFMNQVYFYLDSLFAEKTCYGYAS